jgi:hypothetical protein
VKIVFKKDRETKNTIRFAEVPEQGKEPAVETLYVKKKALEDGGLKDTTEIVVEVTVKS